MLSAGREFVYLLGPGRPVPITLTALPQRTHLDHCALQQAEFDMLFGSGVDLRGEVLDLGVQLGLVGKSGAWFSLNELKGGAEEVGGGGGGDWPIMMGQGREKVRCGLVTVDRASRGRSPSPSSRPLLPPPIKQTSRARPTWRSTRGSSRR